MNTLRRLIYGEILKAVGFVLLAFLSLFLFFDLVDELPALGRVSPLDPQRVYGLNDALLYVLLLVPSRVYELLPIAVLIGAVFVLARFAQSSEFTILRTSGLGPWRALRTLMMLGAGFVALTFVMGDHLAPLSDRAAQLLKAEYQGRISVGRTGAWLKERRDDMQYAINIGAMDSSGQMQDVRIFSIDRDGQVVSLLRAASGQAGRAGDGWLLEQVQEQRLQRTQTDGPPTWTLNQAASLRWPTELSADMVSVALLKPERMGTFGLLSYIRHLEANNQSAQRYEIEFWRKLFYPLSCLVMMVLALPFAYLQLRSGGVAGYVFLGVMIGISFFLLNNVFGYIGNLRAWQPWLAAAAPSMVYSLLSLGAFAWLVFKR